MDCELKVCLKDLNRIVTGTGVVRRFRPIGFYVRHSRCSGVSLRDARTRLMLIAIRCAFCETIAACGGDITSLAVSVNNASQRPKYLSSMGRRKWATSGLPL